MNSLWSIPLWGEVTLSLGGEVKLIHCNFLEQKLMHILWDIHLRGEVRFFGWRDHLTLEMNSPLACKYWGGGGGGGNVYDVWSGEAFLWDPIMRLVLPAPTVPPDILFHVVLLNKSPFWDTAGAKMETSDWLCTKELPLLCATDYQYV